MDHLRNLVGLSPLFTYLLAVGNKGVLSLYNVFPYFLLIKNQYD